MAFVNPSGLLKGGADRMGLIPPPADSTSADQPAQTMEQVLKTKREKIAKDKLGIAPENDPNV